MATIQDVVMQVQDAMGALPGIKAAPDYVPEDEKPFPFIIAYESAGTWTINAVGQTSTTYGEKKWVGDIRIELHVARKDMPRDVQQVAFYSDKVPNAILRELILDRLGSTVDGYARIDTSGLVFMQYLAPNGIGDHIGIIYTVKEIKIRTNIT